MDVDGGVSTVEGVEGLDNGHGTLLTIVARGATKATSNRVPAVTHLVVGGKAAEAPRS
jgi:hypothetical protein